MAVLRYGLFAALLVSLIRSQAHVLDYKTAAHELRPWLRRIRRELHQYPELGLACHETSSLIRGYLHELGILVEYPYAESGLVGRIGSGQPVMVLRADIDALPVHEPEGLDFRSKHDGRMHACGHDVHTTMLLGAAKLLKQHEPHLPTGTVLLVFQPDEEGGTGAALMIQEGAIEGASAAFGMHVMPTIPVGQLATRSGSVMAGQHNFQIIITGRGGHAAMPHLNIDPVPAAAAVIQALQTIVSRETSPLQSAVISVTHLQASETFNITPDQVKLRGTLRALTADHMKQLQQRIQDQVTAAVAPYKCNASVAWDAVDYPPTVNDISMTDLAREAALEVLHTDPMMIAEDFAHFAEAVPAAFMFIGIRNESLGAVHNLHSGKFLVDEEVLHLGAAVHAAVALRYLSRDIEST